jgi:DNA-binding IclR family transcriptional regulator
VSRAALSRFLNLPLETVRRRADRLRKLGILADSPDGLIVTEKNAHRFGNNHHLQTNNMALMRKLLRDLQRCGIHGPEDV